MDDEEKDSLLGRFRPPFRLGEAGIGRYQDVSGDPSGSGLPRGFLGEGKDGRRSLVAEEPQVRPRHFGISDDEDAEIRAGRIEKIERIADESLEDPPTERSRPQALLEADPAPLPRHGHRMPLACPAPLSGYSTRACVTAERTLANAFSTACRSRRAMSHSSSCPSR